jgi:hypothetical protein
MRWTPAFGAAKADELTTDEEPYREVRLFCFVRGLDSQEMGSSIAGFWELSLGCGRGRCTKACHDRTSHGCVNRRWEFAGGRRWGGARIASL